MIAECAHCKRPRVIRARRLCYPCYNREPIRTRYPCQTQDGRGLPDFCGRYKMATAPTHAEPGSPEKIAVLEHRAQSGEQLFHPADLILCKEDCPSWLLPLAPFERSSSATVSTERGCSNSG
jgi:hypothetical protein